MGNACRAGAARAGAEAPEDPGARPRAIEPLSNRHLVHPLAAALLPGAVRLGIPPNAVTLAGLLAGMAAALAYAGWRAPELAAAGFLLMCAWHVLDGLDGMLARATGRASPAGRLLDGIADHLVFIAVYAALAFSFSPAWPAVLLAAAAGAAHVLQASFYEAARATWVRRAAGQLSAPARPVVGGWLEAAYNRLERRMGNRARALDSALARAAPSARAAALRHWQERAALVHRPMELLSANGRTLAIFLACLLGSPVWFWLWEIIALSALALWAGHRLRRLEAEAARLLAAGAP